MNTKKIIIKDIISSSRAISPEDGDKLYNEIIKSIKEGYKVLLDFSNIDILLSVFLNHSIGKIYGTEYKEAFKNGIIEFVNISEQDFHTVEIVQDRAIKFFSGK